MMFLIIIFLFIVFNAHWLWWVALGVILILELFSIAAKGE